MSKTKSKTAYAYAPLPLPRTVVVALIDETGSMLDRKTETLSAYNAYVDRLRTAKDVEIYLHTLKFDKFGTDPVVRALTDEAVRVRDAPCLTTDNYTPRGNTPLYDAIGHAFAQAEQIRHRIGGTRVAVMIQTDGLENASVEFSYLRIKELIAEKQRSGWDITFLAAELADRAYQFASTIGIARGQTMSYATASSAEAFGAAAQNTINYMSTGQSTVFTQEQKRKAGDTVKEGKDGNC